MGQNATDEHVETLTLPADGIPPLRPFSRTAPAVPAAPVAGAPATPVAGLPVPRIPATVLPAPRRGRHFADTAPELPRRVVAGRSPGRVVARVALPDDGRWGRLGRAPLTAREAEEACRYRVAVMYGTDGRSLVLRSVRTATGQATVHLAEPDGTADYHMLVGQVPGGVRITRCSQVFA